MATPSQKKAKISKKVDQIFQKCVLHFFFQKKNRKKKFLDFFFKLIKYFNLPPNTNSNLSINKTSSVAHLAFFSSLLDLSQKIQFLTKLAYKM